jgi:phosphoesterase RecJ-like protein
VLIAHKNPDADSLGAACAFYSYLLRSQKKITLFCISAEVNPNLAFLPWFDKITDRFPEDADCMISFDCGSYGRIGIEKELPLLNIDHHVSNDFYGTHNIINTSAISTTEVVYAILLPMV